MLPFVVVAKDIPRCIDQLIFVPALTAAVQQRNDYEFAQFIIQFGKKFPALQALADQVLVKKCTVASEHVLSRQCLLEAVLALNSVSIT